MGMQKTVEASLTETGTVDSWFARSLNAGCWVSGLG